MNPVGIQKLIVIEENLAPSSQCPLIEDISDNYTKHPRCLFLLGGLRLKEHAGRFLQSDEMPLPIFTFISVK
jgi:hypothetical protein